MRTLILPTRWTQGAAAFLKVVAAMKPNGVRTLVLGGRNHQQAWYAQLWQAWVPATMDPLLKCVDTLVFHEPTQEGMHFIFRRRPTGDGPALAETVRTVKILPGLVDAEEQPPNAWHDLWWGQGMAGDDALGGEDDELLLSATALHINISVGIRGVLTGLHLAHLESLTIEMESIYGDDWEVVDRLLAESAGTLVWLRVMAKELSGMPQRFLPPIA